MCFIDGNHMINLYSKFLGFMFQEFQRCLNFYIAHLLSISRVLYLPSPGCDVTGREYGTIKESLPEIMPEYLFETDGFRMN